MRKLAVGFDFFSKKAGYPYTRLAPKGGEPPAGSNCRALLAESGWPASERGWPALAPRPPKGGEPPAGSNCRVLLAESGCRPRRGVGPRSPPGPLKGVSRPQGPIAARCLLKAVAGLGEAQRL